MDDTAMTGHLYIFAVTVGLATALALVAIWSPRGMLPKLGALGLAALLMPVAYAAYAELMGRPKPVSMEWLQGSADDPAVLGSHLREGEAIFLWVQFRPGAEPAAYRLPWSDERAKELRERQRASAETGRGVRMRWRNRGEATPDEPMFYDDPQPPLPPKPAERER